MRWTFSFLGTEWRSYNKVLLVVLGGGLTLVISIALTDYFTGHYFKHFFERTRSNNTSQLMEMRLQVSAAFEKLHGLALSHKEKNSACDKDLLQAQAALVDANRFIYETALEVPGGRLCTSYGTGSGSLREFAFEQLHAGYQVSGNTARRRYWFNAGPATTLDAGEILIREDSAHLRINKGILLNALALDENVGFGLFERGKAEAILANHAIDYSVEAVATPGTVVHSQDAVFYAYPVKWSELLALVAVPVAYYQTVWIWLFILCSGVLTAVYILLVYILHRVFRLNFSLQAKLKSALRKSHLQILYQPIVDMRTGAVMGAEALMRWTLNDRPISPDEFIPLAETNGMIAELSEWCCEQVAKDMAPLLSYAPSKYVSINLSSVALASPGVAQKLHGILLSFAIPPAQFVFEVTESFTVAGGAAKEQINYLHDLGYKIALDDFGTGSSNISYLEQFPVDIIKIDRSFFAPGRMYSADAMWRHIISIARTLNLVVIAEGVEGQEQVYPLLSFGVKYAQGYHYYKPLPVELFIEAVRNGAGSDIDGKYPAVRLVYTK